MDLQEHSMPPRCRNCSAELHGEYCSACGQRDKDLHVPVKELVTEAADLFPSFDRRVMRSLRPLILSPGLLTLQYLEGKRKHFVSPFKLYFTVSVLFFLISSFMDDSSERSRSEALLAERTPAQRTDTAFVSVGSADNRLRFTVKDSTEAASVLGTQMLTALQRLKQNPDLLFTKIKEHRPKIIFVLLPIFALLLKLLYLRSGTLYIKHLVFSFYFHSFIFLVFLVAELLDPLRIPGIGIAVTLCYAAIPVNLFVGMKQAYGQRTGKTIVKLLLLSGTYAVTFFITIAIAAISIIYLFYL